jgi:hypothetical protein
LSAMRRHKAPNKDGLNQNTAAHSHPCTGIIGHETSKTASKEVYPSKDRGNGSSEFG